MSENLPPNPNVDTFNNSYWITSDTDELQKEIDLLEVQVDTNTSNIATNTSNIATNTSNIATNTSNIATNTSNIATLQTKTQNITATPSSTTMANSLNINFSGESLRMAGNHSYIAAYETAGTRDYYIGTPGAGVKNLLMVNEKQGSITMYSGLDGITPNAGRNKINTYSTGITLHRGGAPEVYGGQIGLVNTTNTDLHLIGNGSNNIYMFSGTGNTTVETTGANSVVRLTTSMLYVGSGTANPNGFYSNINMLDATGNVWETQSRAFTETLRASVFQSAAAVTNWNNIFQNQIIKLNTGTGNVSILGRSTTLTPSTNYPTKTELFNLGIFMNGLFPTYFNASGEWIFNGGATQRVSIQFDINFLGLSTGIKAMVSRILINTAGGAAVEQSRPMGVRYNQAGGNPLNTNLYYSTGQFVTDLQSGYKINLETENFFSTSTDGASVTTSGRLTFYLLPY
jgi:hypothetical protein